MKNTDTAGQKSYDAGKKVSGITLEDYYTYQKALFLDMVYLQQDAFDPVDVSVPLARQRKCFDLICAIVDKEYEMADKQEVRDFFTRLISLFKSFNYAREDSPDYQHCWEELHKLTNV